MSATASVAGGDRKGAPEAPAGVLRGKTLIFGTAYVATQEQRYAFTLWRDLVTKLNPATDILVVDSASPALPDTGPIKVLQLGDNIGHLGTTGRDGWGRAFCAGLRYATEAGYDRAVHIETDLLLARPVAPIIAKMEAVGVRIAAPMANPHQFIETALMFMDVQHMFESKFIEAYDWEQVTPGIFPENRIWQIMEQTLFGLPMRGLRNDLGQLTPKTMARMFPLGMDWLTHADPATLRAFMGVNGHA